MKVTYFLNTKGGCDWYRAKSPIETATFAGAIASKEIWPQQVLTDIQFNRKRFDDYMSADVFVVQRVIGVGFIKRIIENARKYNPKAKVVMDFDDNLFKVSPLSNHYADYGVEEVKLRLADGSEHWAWKDGKNIDLSVNRKRMDEIRESLGLVDMVTVTTDILAECFRTYNENIRVLPNCVDTNSWRPWPLIRSKYIRLYWGGGMSHWEDIAIIRNVIKRIVKKYDNVQIVFMGWKPEGIEQELGDRFEYHSWVETPAYPYKVASLIPDIGIIPLVDNDFNRCKSAIKWIELSALGVPSVTSLVSPYKEMTELHEDNGVYIENNDEDSWVDGISMLVEDAELRKKLGEAARETVVNNFDINTQYHQWVNAYNEVLTWPRPQSLLKAQ